ncbi:hypothetical protein CYMTET_29503 [Cymbomonas tetramitiformis]|uniref:Uncharacterized protein n=1 Tax=Cymbomonas tetramitiformis TaxID=36881 RepID=A0AAE0FKX1_9CHLO|nr:hypothetical protein CYMTET_29503 [Cymbomonas tetramitiformis]
MSECRELKEEKDSLLEKNKQQFDERQEAQQQEAEDMRRKAEMIKQDLEAKELECMQLKRKFQNGEQQQIVSSAARRPVFHPLGAREMPGTVSTSQAGVSMLWDPKSIEPTQGQMRGSRWSMLDVNNKQAGMQAGMIVSQAGRQQE